MAFLTLFRVSTAPARTGTPVYFVTLVLVAQFVLVNVVVAVLMKHLEESNKEAREDTELDAEIGLEMAQGPGDARRVDVDGPPSPQESQGAGHAPNLLVARKVSVSRMLSLPNDSYMFWPVAPAPSPRPHPLQEVEMETYGGGTCSGSATSVHSPPTESCASLQVPLTVSSPARSSESIHTLSPRCTARSPTLSRLRTDSLEGQIDSSRDTLDPAEPPEKTLRPHPEAHLRTALRLQPAGGPRRRGRGCDPAEEEVSHITSSACPWQPATEPYGPEASPARCGSERDLRRFYSVDAQGFLDKPGRADEQWRPLAEPGSGEPGEAKVWGPDAEPALGARRKKMSPPCISVDHPAENEGSLRPPATEGSSTTLRRRTPSCKAAPHRDSLEPTEGSGPEGTLQARWSAGARPPAGPST
ncbi:Voltage-dependent T-type calcium channel subunit alpha-1H [Saguinus oedipus]|uniref:Voltage-dependent T-type calcium channel subunit alpha-1H n=1 Tax=Saguinus oedipus TaxID=9490 RepID=A0ABQ9UB99_SAGOE|nr:Voltage-dependent T-type calcium channel subunit alpha-1H [Saguinus oedipus]